MVPSKTRVFIPVPPSIVSAPLNPTKVSLPAPPTKVSLPQPPVIVSSPLPPKTAKPAVRFCVAPSTIRLLAIAEPSIVKCWLACTFSTLPSLSCKLNDPVVLSTNFSTLTKLVAFKTKSLLSER